MVNGILEGEVRIVCVGRLCVDCAGGAGGEDCALEQRVRGQPVGAMHSGARDLADGEEPFDARATVTIRGHPAHEVVGGRSDGNEVPGQIEAISGKTGGDARELRLHIRDGPRIEEARASVLSGLTAMQSESDDVAGGELGAIVDVIHEPAALLIEEERTGPADGFGDEEAGTGKGCGMELEELEISDLDTGTDGGGKTVSGRSGRVRRVREKLPGPAGGQHDRVGGQGLDATVAEHGDSRGSNRSLLVVAGEDVDEHCVLEQSDATCGHLGAQLLRQNRADRPTGRITSGM